MLACGSVPVKYLPELVRSAWAWSNMNLCKSNRIRHKLDLESGDMSRRIKARTCPRNPKTAHHPVRELLQLLVMNWREFLQLAALTGAQALAAGTAMGATPANRRRSRQPLIKDNP